MSTNQDTWHSNLILAVRTALARPYTSPWELRRVGRALVAAGELREGFGVGRDLESACRALGAPLPPELAERATRKQSNWCLRHWVATPADRFEACELIRTWRES